MSKEKGERKSQKFSGSLLTILLFAVMLIIPLAFFFLLDQKTGSGFGLVEIFFSLVFAVVTTSFLLWVKSFMMTRPYLGLIIGLVVLIAFEYGLFLRYWGPRTTIFAIIMALVVIVYLGIYFLRFRKMNFKPEEFNDNL